MLISSPYSKLKKDPFGKHLSDIKPIVERSVFLNDNTKCFVVTSIVNCDHYYVFPKVHKHTLSFCLIVSDIGTVPDKLAKFLSKLLAPLFSTNFHTVKNTFDFVDKIKRLSICNYKMVSLDVKSLFTNVPDQGAIDCLERRLLKFHCASSDIDEILQLVSICARQTAF